jgi:hypothetical protein
MKACNKYKWELLPYFSCKNEEGSELSAKCIYGKFLKYVDEEDYVGANLARDFLKRGKFSHKEKNNKFSFFYKRACTDERFRSLKDHFYQALP